MRQKSLSNYRFCNVFLPNSVKCENRTKSKVILALIYCVGNHSVSILHIAHETERQMSDVIISMAGDEIMTPKD